MKIAGVFLILSICLHTVFSDDAVTDKPTTSTTTAVGSGETESFEESDGPSTTIAPKTNSTAAVEATDKPLTVSGSETVELKAEHKEDASSDEKLGTSATIPVGFTSNGLIYSSPFRTSPFAGLGFGFGRRQFGFPADYQGGYRGAPAQFQAGGYNQQILPKQDRYVGGAFGGYRNTHQPTFGTGQYLGQGQRLASHGEVIKGYPVLQNPQIHAQPQGYGGVAYAGHGVGHEAGPAHHPVGGYGQQEVTVNKQTEVGVGPYGEIHRGDIIQKTVNTVEGASPIGAPFSPYGQGGVVYMGNGHISEHAAGVHTTGPVQPPHGYQQQNVAIHKQTNIGPYGEVHTGVAIQKEAVNGLGHGPPYPEPSHQQLLPEYQTPGYQIGSYQQQEHGLINKQTEQIHGYDPEHAHHVNKEAALQKAVGAYPIGSYQQQEHGIINKQVEQINGYDPEHAHHVNKEAAIQKAAGAYQIGSYQQQEHGIINKQVEQINGYDPNHAHHVNKEVVAVQKAVGTLGGPNPGVGLGYNGQENHAIAHQDQAFVGASGIVDRQGPGNYEQTYNPDPYFNNQVDPIYRKPPTNLRTTGPNPYYQGKNPVGVYEPYNRVV